MWLFPSVSPWAIGSSSSVYGVSRYHHLARESSMSFHPMKRRSFFCHGADRLLWDLQKCGFSRYGVCIVAVARDVAELGRGPALTCWRLWGPSNLHCAILDSPESTQENIDVLGRGAFDFLLPFLFSAFWKYSVIAGHHIQTCALFQRFLAIGFSVGVFDIAFCVRDVLRRRPDSLRCLSTW